jgi:hypothetical protein
MTAVCEVVVLVEWGKITAKAGCEGVQGADISTRVVHLGKT